jgi:hypothetical protein
MTWVLSNHSHDLLLDGDPEDQRLEIFDSAFDHIFLLDDVLVSFIEIIGNIRKLQWLPDSLFELVNFVQKLLNVLTRLHLDVVVNADLLNESIVLYGMVKIKLVVIKLTGFFYPPLQAS